MSAFITDLVVKSLGPDWWRLFEPLIYQSDITGRVHTVPTGFETDLESIPRWLPFAYAIAKGRAQKPAVVHDFLYKTPWVPKELADDVFDEAMGVIGLADPLRHMMWHAVHMFGRPTYKRLQARASRGFAHRRSLVLLDRRRQVSAPVNPVDSDDSKEEIHG